MSRWLALFIFAVGMLSWEVFAAGPRMHVVLGEKWLTQFAPNYSEEEKKLFQLGTVFPDIRYLGVIKRSQSHFKGVTLAKILEAKTPFERGMLLHSYVDEYRDKLVRKSGIIKKMTDIPVNQRDAFLKLVEDQVLSPQYDWDQIRNDLSTIPDEEKAYGIEQSSLTQWHTGLTLYFSTMPSFILTQASLFETRILTLDAATVKLWSDLLPKYANDEEYKKHVEVILTAFNQSFIRKS